MNVTRLQQPPPQSSSTRSVSEAEDITPDFLSIRLVNQRTRVRLSPEPLDLSFIPNKAQLFVVAATLGWFVAVVKSNTGLALVSSPLADLRSQLSSQDANTDNTFQPQRTIPFASVTPNYLVFACNDTRLVVGLTQGPVIVFDASAICSTGTNEVTSLHTFHPTTITPTAVRQMYANPGDIPELVVLLREPDGSPDSQLVEVINVSTLQSVAGWSSGGTPETFPASISWSPKGKQLAIALQSGDIITFSPSVTQQAKSFVAHPSSMQGQSIVHTTWLSNPAFYTIFSSASALDPQADQKHMVIVHDAKRPDTSSDVILPIEFFPNGVRPPGAFTVALKEWDPAKIILLIGDSTTADIGLVCCTADDKWQKLSFEEAAPSMPLDADQNETTMIGFELDLQNTTPYDVATSTGEIVSVPPPPVVWAYASDGTVFAWYVVNTRGTPYQGKGLATHSPVVAPAAASAPAISPFSQVAQPTLGQSSQSTFGLSTFSGQPASSFGFTTPSFGQSGFGQTRTTGSASAQPPTFGNSAFEAASSTFAQGSSSGQAPSGGAFASSSIKWGQTNSGLTPTGFVSAATAPSQRSQSPSAPSSTPPASPQITADSAKSSSPPASTTPVGPPPTANAFMSLRMSTGFGLSNFIAKDSPFGKPKPVSQTVSAFGDQASAPKVPVPATPGSVFGQTSVIGATTKPSPVFAQPAFGSPSTPSASPSDTPITSKTPSSDAFSAFSGSASAFGKSGGSGVPFSDMLRAGGPSHDGNKLEEPPKTPESSSGSTPATLKSAFDKSPAPQPAKVPTSHESDDEEEEKGKGQPVSAASSFGNLSSSTSSFVDVSRGGEEEDGEAEPTTPSSDGGHSERGEQQIEDFLSDTYSEGESDRERDEVEDEESEGEERDEDEEDEDEEDHGGDEGQDGTEDAEKKAPPSDEADPTTVPLPASRSPSNTPKRPSINEQPTRLFEPPSKASQSELVRSTTPPGSPSKELLSLQTPLQQPTPTLPSPSLSPSPASAIGFGRPNTRPLRSSPLANTPVSGGDEEEVKGEKPVAPKPHQAFPKTPLGQWDGGAMSPSPSPAEVRPTPPQPGVEPLVDRNAKAAPSAITRPKTPPLLGTKGIALNNNSTSLLATATAMVPVTSPMPALNLGGFSYGDAVKPYPKSAAEDVTRPATTPAASPFSGLKPGAFSLMPKPEPIAGTPPASDTKSTPTPGTVFALGATAKLSLAPAAGSPFVGLSGAKSGATTPAITATIGKSAMSTPTRVSTAPPHVTPPKDEPSAERLHPMQIEFTNLITEIGTELANLAKHSREARERRSKTIRPTPPVDVEGLVKTIRESERDVEQLELARSEDHATIRELEIGVLKAKTRKEEIARFDKARSDVEFGKMLKARFLSPEQTELQTQLRRNIRSIQDRVAKMEDHLQASKKKVHESRTGRPSMTPPSLDTINRTSRNIDLAIRQQTVDVTALTARVATLNLDGVSSSGTPSRIRERDVVRRPLDVTPHVASTTAAALNAEQSAHRLKEALLAVRTKPLLNTQAAQAKPAPRAFETPQKPSVDHTSSAASSGSSFFSSRFTLPPLGAGTGSSSPPVNAGRRGNAQKYHAKSVPLKSAPTGATPPKPVFDWGPLPGIKPMTMISPDLRSRTA